MIDDVRFFDTRLAGVGRAVIEINHLASPGVCLEGGMVERI